MKIFERINDIIHNTLLRVDNLSGSRLYLARSYRLLYYTVRGVNLHRTFVESAALTLYTMFALVPLLALVLLILGRLGSLQPAIDSLYVAFAEWSSLLDKVLDTARAAADNLPNGIFAIIGIGTLLWAIFAVFRSVEESFNHIWGIRRTRRFWKRYLAYLVIAIVVPALWGLATSFTLDLFSFIGLSGNMSVAAERLISVAITSLGATLLYKYLPYTPVAWRNAWRSGIIAGVLLMLWQWGYVYVQGYMTSYNTIYGSFAAIPLFIIWLQWSWNIILFGCELSFVWQNSLRYELIDRRRLRPTHRGGERERVVVIGSGNVAECFAIALAQNEAIDLRQVYARNPLRGRAVATAAATSWTDNPEELADADIYIIAVSDKAVESVASSLKFPDDAVVVHTAGSVPMSAIRGREGRRGILYALQSFSAGRHISLGDVPIFVEADNDEVRDMLLSFARKLSTEVDYADSERRRTIHLAGVFVNNFANHLFALGADIVEEEGMRYDILKPLIRETADKATSVDEPEKVQTGPAVRGDRAVTEKHIAMLQKSERRQNIYKEITNSIWETSKKI